MADVKAIGQRIAQLRRDAGETQASLAEDLGVGRTTLTMIELGRDQPGISTAIALADRFKVPLDWLLCRKPPAGGPLVGQFVEDANELALLGWWRSLSVSDRYAATRMLRIPGIPGIDDRLSA
jgi:transcriptional regulator with XRE-family HTH domain